MLSVEMARTLIRELAGSRAVLSNRWSLLGSNYLRPFSVLTSTRFQQQKLSQDRIEMFVQPEVQTLLKKLTGRDYQRVFRKRKIGQKAKEPRYTFMTEEQLQQSLKDAEERADKLLQMPPVLRPREPINKIFHFDPQIQGLEKSSIIFTDITMNVSDRDRLIVARDPDGTLRHATWEERDKMNMIYFPKEGKEYTVPRMFSEPELFQDLLDRASEKDNTYEFILDRACLQFEPDDPAFINIYEKTYQTIDKKLHYDFLKSTRHYGPMVFYLTRTRQMDNLIMFSIRHERVTGDAINLVSLFHFLFPESKSKVVSQKMTEPVDKLRAYIELDAIKRNELELELNAYEEGVKKRMQFTQELEKAHGMQT